MPAQQRRRPPDGWRSHRNLTPTEDGPTAVPASTAEVEADFLLPAFGTRLEFKILGLGDDPKPCTAVGFLVGDDQRSANATRAHYFPEHVELGPDSRVKAFVAFDGSPALTPARLRYADGTQTPTVHLRGTWVGA